MKRQHTSTFFLQWIIEQDVTITDGNIQGFYSLVVKTRNVEQFIIFCGQWKIFGFSSNIDISIWFYIYFSTIYLSVSNFFGFSLRWHRNIDYIDTILFFQARMNLTIYFKNFSRLLLYLLISHENYFFSSARILSQFFLIHQEIELNFQNIIKKKEYFTIK